jgi:hypothetical protein
MDLNVLEFDDLPEHVTPLEAVILIKALDEDGVLTLIERVTTGLSDWEALGAAITFADGLRRRLIASESDD